MPLIQTTGAASSRGFGQFARTGTAVYIEDVFSTFLYTGTGASLPIVNGIDLATFGGLVWTKARNSTAQHKWYDSARGIEYAIESNTTDANQSEPTGITSFNSTGYTYGTDGNTNSSGTTYVSWTFREQSKFFDVVTWTGNGGTSGRTFSHNLGSAPGCIIVKNTTSSEDWYVYHRSLGNTGVNQYFCILNSTAAQDTGGFGMEKASNWTATQFALSSGGSALNANGATYVAYLFAHDAGGFGASGTDNVISCGSFTVSGGVASITLGWEPQYILSKGTGAGTGWNIFDTARGWNMGSADKDLLANTSAAEADNSFGNPTATGFDIAAWPNGTFIYIAIRRGPMKTPTSGTSVYNAIARSGTGAAATVTGVGFAPDLLMSKIRDSTVGTNWSDRLRGPTQNLDSSSTSAEATSANRVTALGQDGFSLGTASEVNASGFTYINWNFRRAPGFFDVVCYTGTGSATTFSHNLGVVPEMMIVKRRDTSADWWVYDAATGNTKYQVLNSTATPTTSSTAWNNTTPTSSVFSVGTGTPVNASAGTYVAYLFATVAGVSKVGSYTGTGTTLQVNCGFTAGSRFVLIKRTDSTGDWYVWDSARGIVAGNDPYLLLNSTAAEVTSTDYVDTYNAGFEISSTAPAAINANGGTFIFLAIA